MSVRSGAMRIVVADRGPELGWFSSMWTTCCSELEQQAASILKDRC